MVQHCDSYTSYGYRNPIEYLNNFDLWTKGGNADGRNSVYTFDLTANLHSFAEAA